MNSFKSMVNAFGGLSREGSEGRVSAREMKNMCITEQRGLNTREALRELSQTVGEAIVYLWRGRLSSGEICIAVTDSGKYLRNGHFVYRAVDRTDQTGAGKGRGEVPDRDHACYVHSGGCWADGVLGNVETVCTACQCHYCYHDRDGHGSNRNLFTMGDPERKKAGRGRST